MKSFAVIILLAVLTASVALGLTIGEVKQLPDATPATLTGKIVTSSNGELVSRFYIEEPDRSAGVQVYTGIVSLPDVTEGKIVTVSGAIYTNPQGERAMNNVTVTVTGSTTPLRPVTIANRNAGGEAFGLQGGVRGGIGLNNIGLLVRVSGWVSFVDSGGSYIELDDGSGPVQIDVSRLSSKPMMGDYIVVTGLMSCKTTGSERIAIVRPRRQSDVTFSTPSLEQCMVLPIPAGKIGIFWLGQAGFLLKDHEERKIVIDPYLSDYCRVMVGSEWERLVPIPIQPERLQPGLTLLTHDHADHTDPWTLNPIYVSSLSVFWGPTSSYNHMGAPDIGIPAGRRAVLNRGQTASWNGIQITAVYANHTEDSVGFVINMAGRKIYISGDTSYNTTLVNAVAAQRPDITLVCINGKYDNMNASEAASLVKACSPQVAIPMHYGMFAINTADPQTFVTACASQGVTAKVIVMRHGSRVLL